MDLNFSKGDGLVPAVIQEAGTCKVLMLGYMNEDAFKNTKASGFVTFFSRSRHKMWVKGESSGHRLKVVDILVDCDSDALVVVAEQSGPGTCHEGYRSCFFRRLQGEKWVETEPRSFDPAKVYGGNS